MNHRVQIVVGGQYGSEAKGAIAAHLVTTEGIDYCVRTGATNAGHTVEYNGKRYAMQQLPVGWVRLSAQLVLGAGALIDPEILERECAMVTEATGIDVRRRLTIDYRAYIHRREHAERSSESGRHVKIGATGKGCSEALIDRIRLRGVMDWTVGRSELFHSYRTTDTEYLLNDAWEQGARIQLEGTQGQLLDLYLGPYPYTTHKQTGPAQWLLEAGLSPALPLDIVMVIRTFPIRVAGNSGPLANEISWVQLANEINLKRAKVGMDPIVNSKDLELFEYAVIRESERFDLPPDSDGLDQHRWTLTERQTYALALSELNARAMRALPDDVRDRLRALFEITTVTKKLRRIGRASNLDLRKAARQIRPTRVALTFLNYAFPERWYTDDPVSGPELHYLRNIEECCQAPVAFINRGPDAAHIVDARIRMAAAS